MFYGTKLLFSSQTAKKKAKNLGKNFRFLVKMVNLVVIFNTLR